MPSPRRESASLSVMVVDDIRLVRDVASKLLRRCGVTRISIYADGAEALAGLERIEDNVDLILLDLNMPGMDGAEFLRHLAARNYIGRVALMSAESVRVLRTAEALARAHNLNIIGYIEKPLTLETIERVLGSIGSSAPRVVADPDQPLAEAELLNGISDGQIYIEVQPKVEIRTRQLIGVEALARWRHPVRGVIPPGRFVPLAESGAAARPLFQAVLGQAVKALARWRALGLRLTVAVNISTVNLSQLSLPDEIAAEVAAVGLKPGDLVLEVTESLLIRDLTAALEVLTRLRLKGFGLSIDDFGTGYSSMEQLQRIPFDELKIDRQFVCGAAQDPAARAILSSSIRLARTLGMAAVAEGIETEEDWECALRLGCDIAQGYFIARPLPVEILPNWAAAWS